jgi:hypothetical protein
MLRNSDRWARRPPPRVSAGFTPFLPNVAVSRDRRLQTKCATHCLTKCAAHEPGPKQACPYASPAHLIRLYFDTSTKHITGPHFLRSHHESTESD